MLVLELLVIVLLHTLLNHVRRRPFIIVILAPLIAEFAGILGEDVFCFEGLIHLKKLRL